jgi:hypothetical protein
MTITNYCCDVQAAVKNGKPAERGPEWDEWFGDTGRASNALTAALEGKRSKALRIAEPLAERYGL